MIPAFFNAIGMPSAEVVDVRVFGTDGTTAFVSNELKGLSVTALPAVDAQPGAITAALLTATQNISLSAQNAALKNSAYSGMVAPLGQLSQDVGPIIASLTNWNGNPITVATTSGSTSISALQINQSDEIAQTLVATFMTQAGIPLVPLEQVCPASTGNSGFDMNLCSIQLYFQNLLNQTTPASKRARQMSAARAQAALTKFQAAGATFALNLSLGIICEIADPFGGGIAYELVVAPVVGTFISSMVVNQEIPSTTDVKLGVAFAVVDKFGFGGVPVSATTWDELQVLYGFFSDGPPSPQSGQIPSGVIVYDAGALPSSLNSWTTAGQPINDNIGLPEWNNNVSGEDSTLYVIGNSGPPPPPTTYYTLSTSAGPGGTVSNVPSGTSFAAGTKVTVTATASSGYIFSSWSGACAGQGAVCVLTMNSDLSTAASFAQQVAPPPPPPGSVTFTGQEYGTMTVPEDQENDGTSCSYWEDMTLNWTQSGNSISGTWSFTNSVFTFGTGIPYGGMCPMEVNSSDTFTGTISSTGISITGSQGETFSATFFADGTGLNGSGSVPELNPYGLAYTDTFVLGSSVTANFKRAPGRR
jgi:hypothetical protein